MNLGNFLEGFNILQKHYNDPNGYNIGADHDVVYAYATDTPLDTEELKKMIELGWEQDISYAGDEYAYSDYAPEDGWTAYV